jgi:hypothetical protein
VVDVEAVPVIGAVVVHVTAFAEVPTTVAGEVAVL